MQSQVVTSMQGRDCALHSLVLVSLSDSTGAESHVPAVTLQQLFDAGPLPRMPDSAQGVLGTDPATAAWMSTALGQGGAVSRSPWPM